MKTEKLKVVLLFLKKFSLASYDLLKYIFLDQMRRKEFFTSLLSDYLALVLIAFGGFLFVLCAVINWALFFLLILFLALFSTLGYFRKLKNKS